MHTEGLHVGTCIAGCVVSILYSTRPCDRILPWRSSIAGIPFAVSWHILSFALPVYVG